MRTRKHTSSKKAFTLVELIVVLTLMAIAAAMALNFFSDYSSDSRDGNRLAAISALQSGLEMFYTKTSAYPLPDDEYGIGIMSEDTLNHVGYAGDSMMIGINMSEVPKDPLYDERYTYGVSEEQKYYQVAGLFENDSVAIFGVSKTYASDDPIIKVKGNYQFPLKLNNKLRPLPNLLFIGNVKDEGYMGVDVEEPFVPQTTTQELLLELTGTNITLTPVTISTGLTIEAFRQISDTQLHQTYSGLGLTDRNYLGRLLFGDKYFTR